MGKNYKCVKVKTGKHVENSSAACKILATWKTFRGINSIKLIIMGMDCDRSNASRLIKKYLIRRNGKVSRQCNNNIIFLYYLNTFLSNKSILQGFNEQWTWKKKHENAER